MSCMQSSLAHPSLEEEATTMKLNENNPSLQTESSVTCTYQAVLEASTRNLVITWYKASTSHSLAITIENMYNEDHQTCEVDFHASQLWSRKGLKSLNVDDDVRVDIYWDFRGAKFCGNPEPCSDYYVAIVCDKQMVLLLGDLKADAFKRTLSRPTQVCPTLLHKEEILYGKNRFETKVLLGEGPKEHDVTIENRQLKHGEEELRVSIDGRVVVRVMNLNWMFRGNETVLVNNVPIQIFWDVHDWLFNNNGSAHGLFIFKPGSLHSLLDEDNNSMKEGEGEDEDDESAVVGGCCHFVFAVKVDET
ncbi:uncharacterized protein LOC141619749 [Silene latifolia]|uniref:uncharacterized protein LOC141619749 n=1 Tax=Silene latifolia TaxID=37657 RepID=UPI003D775DAA